MPQTKEERRKSNRISQWKCQGIIVKGNNWDTFYDYALSITHCQKCPKKLTNDKRNTHSTRMVDHDHNISDRENFRYICCNACNNIDKSTNTSGIPNVFYRNDNESWCFQKMIQGKTYRKSGFKTIEEAIDYKLNFLLKLRILPPNEGELQSINQERLPGDSGSVKLSFACRA
tara:strand:- start:64 stop:582 length:519 start_codon:yes stop_codon:yes gene_type:complete